MTLSHHRRHREEEVDGEDDTGICVIRGEEDGKQCFEQACVASHHRKGNEGSWSWQRRESDGMMGCTSGQGVDEGRESKDDRRLGEWQIAIQSI